MSDVDETVSTATWAGGTFKGSGEAGGKAATATLTVSSAGKVSGKFVVTKGNIAQMYHAPGRKREFNAFVLDKTYFGPYDETTCIDWTDDSR